MSLNFAQPRGTVDILPDEVGRWQHIESSARDYFSLYNYKEIRTPSFEDRDLFVRSMGQTSDVVQKQILSLTVQGEENVTRSRLALRPECTASVVRSYIQNSLERKETLSKLFYIGSMFRGERPQKGRLREFHQMGVEVIGADSKSPFLDAEVIILSVNFLKVLGLKGFKLKINTLGSQEDKVNFSKRLREDIKPYFSKLSKESQVRFEHNIFRILDSKSEEDRDIVRKLNLDYSHLSKGSLGHYNQVKAVLKSLAIDFEESIGLVRGLDYYTHTVFEISDSSLGAQDALGAGGRYGTLVAQLGGSTNVDAVGFALGIERIILAGSNLSVKTEDLQVFLIGFGERGSVKAFETLERLRSYGIKSDMSFKSSSMKSQMRIANKSCSKYGVIIGDEECINNTFILKCMDSGEQKVVNLEELINKFKK